MKIQEEKILELQRIYRDKYGEDISFEEVKKLGSKLVGLVRAVYEI